MTIDKKDSAVFWKNFFVKTAKESNWTIEDLLKDDGDLIQGWFANVIEASNDYREANYEGLNPREAVTAFVAKITTGETVTVGSSQDCAPIAKLLTEFCDLQNLEPIRDNIWPDNIKR